MNISVDDLVDEYLPYYLLDLVKQHRLAPRKSTLEVTESAMMHNVHKSLAVVTASTSSASESRSTTSAPASRRSRS